MPLNQSLLRALQKQYGAKEGKQVAYAMETKAKKGRSRGGVLPMPAMTAADMKGSGSKGRKKVVKKAAQGKAKKQAAYA